MVCAPVRSIIPSRKLGDYLSVQAHKPCSICWMVWSMWTAVSYFCYKGNQLSRLLGCCWVTFKLGVNSKEEFTPLKAAILQPSGQIVSKYLNIKLYCNRLTFDIKSMKKEIKAVSDHLFRCPFQISQTSYDSKCHLQPRRFREAKNMKYLCNTQ